MINERLLAAAQRSRAESLSVATTGSTTLSATATGYARASGSFITDGFAVGMEVKPTGFTQTATGIITAVTATALAIDGGRTVQASGSGRTLAVGLPAIRIYDNKKGTPSALVPYVTNEFVQGVTGVKTLPTKRGRLEEDWLSFWTFYGIAGTGDDALLAYADALKALFAGGTVITLSDASNAYVPGDKAPKRGQIIPVDGGWARCMVTVQLRGSTRNVVAA